MPELKEFTGGAHELRAGDIIDHVSPPEAVKAGKTNIKGSPRVARVKTLAKNVLVTVEVGAATADAAIRLGADVHYRREVPTEEEKAARERENFESDVKRAVDNFESWSTLDPMAFLNEKTEGVAPAYVADTLTSYVNKAYEMSVRREIGDTVKSIRHDPERDETDEQILDYVIDDARRYINTQVRYLEASTSAQSNIYKRITLATYGELLDDWTVKSVEYHRNKKN